MLPAEPLGGREPQPQPVIVEPEEDSEMKQAETKAFRNWIKKRPGADVDDFNSNELSRADKMAAAYEVGNAQDATFRRRSDNKTDYP